jgi:tetratricopeptide (TPR) repeat protein
MTLSRLKAHAQAQAVRRFTNRENAKTAFSEALQACAQDPARLSVLVFYGFGGIGKSSLLRHLRRHNLSSSGSRTVMIDLEAAHYGSQLDYLLDLRHQLKIDAPLFDYAVARFITVSGRSLKEIDRRWVPEDSLLYDLQELACDMAEVVAPARLVSRLSSQLNRVRQRRWGALRDSFREIDKLDFEALGAHLPFYLGQALQAARSSSPSPVIVFVDSVECLSSRRYYRLTKEDPDAWLRECIACAASGLWVLAGRNRVTWGDEQPEWERYLDQHLVGPLDDTDADGFLRGIPIHDSDIRRAIIDSAKGVPLYLDLCASTFLIRAAAGESLRPADFEIPEQEVIRRFLAHLEPEQREAVRVLSVLRAFDHGLFSALNRSLNIGIPDTLFEEFCATAFITRARGGDSELHSVHRLVRSYVAPQLDTRTRLAIASVLIAEAAASASAREDARSIRLLAEYARIGAGASADLPEPTIFTLLDTATELIDRGHWVAVDNALSELADAAPDNVSHETALAFLRGLCARKRGELATALNYYSAAEEGAFLLGHYQPLLRYHLAHARHLSGEYSAAAPVYDQLAEGNDQRQRRVLLLARRQVADLAMLQGRFRTALEAFDGLLGRVPEDPLWEAETHRFRGHVHRFNFFLEEAETCYESARRIAEASGADAMLGKVMTNLAETRCWSRPQAALADAKAAIELNREVAAPIEVGKAIAARAIALAQLGQPNDGLLAAHEAIGCQRRTGYRAGSLFGHLAEGVSHAAASDREGVAAALAAIERESAALTVYGFLAVPLHGILEGPDHRPASGYEWLDTAPAKRMRAVLPRLPP